MGVSENIFSAVFIVVFTIFVGIYIYNGSVEFAVNEYELEKNEFVYDMYSNDFNSVLLITENNSRRSMGNLLANALYYNTEVLNFSNSSINVTSKLKNILDSIYGEKNYYFEIKPRIVDLSLNFVIDGSDSLGDERELLGRELPFLMEKIKEQINETGDEIVISNIYILGDKKNSDDVEKCYPFDGASPNIACYIIGKEELYDVRNKSLGNYTYDNTDKELYKTQFNITPPYDNLSFVRLARKQGEKDYYEADWGSGTAYVSAMAKDTAKLVIIFPMGDELSTSSISEDCFNVNTTPEQKICDICSQSCSDSLDTETELRSMKTVKNGAIVADANGHIVNPIFAYSCDYNYKPIFNTYFEIVHGKATTNACMESECVGCSLNSSDNVCFHSECKQEIVRQMDFLANSTGGKVIDLDELEELVYNVEGVVNDSIESFKITIGEPLNRTEKYVIKRKVPLPNKLMTDLRIEILANKREMGLVAGNQSIIVNEEESEDEALDDDLSDDTPDDEIDAPSDDLERVLNVGPDREYKKPSEVISVLEDGDTVEIDEGTYLGDFVIWDKDNITIRGIGDVVLDATGYTIPNKKAIWVINGDNVIVDNIEFKGAVVPDKNGAGIRIQSKNLTIINSYFHDNEMGILTWNDADSILTIKNSHFAYNGYGDGYSHNMYIGKIKNFTISSSYSHHSLIGHTLKSRARENHIYYNKFIDGSNGRSSYLIDIPNGGKSFIVGNILQQGPLTDNPHMVSYGAEGITNPVQEVYFISNTLVNDKSSGSSWGLRIVSGVDQIVENNIFSGLNQVFDGAGDITRNIILDKGNFTDAVNYDYRLVSGSLAIDSAYDSSIIPQFEYDHLAKIKAREDDGNLDFGAFEH